MSDLASFRLDRELARALARVARERGVPKSQIVREALTRYLATPDAAPAPLTVRERSAPYIGAIRLKRPAAHDDLARLIRDRNWRD